MCAHAAAGCGIRDEGSAPLFFSFFTDTRTYSVLSLEAFTIQA